MCPVPCNQSKQTYWRMDNTKQRQMWMSALTPVFVIKKKGVIVRMLCLTGGLNIVLVSSYSDLKNWEFHFLTFVTCYYAS